MADAPIEGLWLNLAELGQHRGTSSQAVGKRVRRLEKLGAITTRKGPNGARLVNVAEFERAITATGDAIATANGGGNPIPSPADDIEAPSRDPVLAKEQARRTAYQADLAWMDREERRKTLVVADEVRQGAVEAAEAVGRAFDALASRLDDILSIASRDGRAAARAFVVGLGRDAQLSLSRALAQRAAEVAEVGP